MTDAELLTQVETAISSVLSNGQAIGGPAGTWTKADLPTLYKMRIDLQQRVSAGSSHPLKRAWVGAPVRY